MKDFRDLRFLFLISRQAEFFLKKTEKNIPFLTAIPGSDHEIIPFIEGAASIKKKPPL